jgi:hypothetical protein
MVLEARIGWEDVFTAMSLERWAKFLVFCVIFCEEFQIVLRNV